MAEPARKRYEALDSLRGICACAVVLFHLQVTGGLAAWPLFRNAWLLVDFFFVLSGFVIMASYGQRLANGFSPLAFMMLRLGRVYPVHIIMIAAYAAIECVSLLLHLDVFTGRAAFTGSQSLPALFQNLALVQIFGLDDSVTWNGPSWSIAAEIWTYLIVALGLTFMGMRFLLVMAAVVLIAPLILTAAGDKGLAWTYSWSLVRCLYGFGIGMLAYQVHIARGERQSRYASLIEGAAALACIGALMLIGPGPVEYAMPPLFACTILIFAREGGVVSRLLCAAPMRALGLWSYSIYMVHTFVITRTTDVLKLVGPMLDIELVSTQLPSGNPGKVLVGSDLLQSVVALAVLAVVILLAALCYRFVEEPGRIASRRLVERYRRSAGSAAESVAPSS
ncbi:MAG: acyltransferase family protein [Sphingobium sp.]